MRTEDFNKELTAKHGQTLVNLAERWQDELEYEDIEEYGKVVRNVVGPEITIIKMMKRPFGFYYKHAAHTATWVLQVRLQGKHVSVSVSQDTAGDPIPDSAFAEPPVTAPTAPPPKCVPVPKAGKKLYMAYNHNNTPLMEEPGSLGGANAEAKFYKYQTGNAAYVALFEG